MSSELLIIIPLLTGFLLDSVLGDPLWLPHPIRLFGQVIFICNGKLNSGNYRKVKGTVMAILLISATFLGFWILLKLAQRVEILFVVLASLSVFYGLANRSLIMEAHKVISTLEKHGLEAGRKQLSHIVGRETKNLNEQQIRTAVLETLAENLSDGVIAPLFFYAVGGVPTMMAYKMANTLDSMIGYKSEQFRQFGWFAARFDDLLNFIPARLTALLMVVLSLSPRGLAYIFRYGHRHNSPNAGYPEAALSGILNCRFGGPNVYHGVLVKKPFIGGNARVLTNTDCYKTHFLNLMSCLVMIGLICLMQFI
ncbi:MAG: adenosylcobinamide-phosphate synthase CbiB [Bacteroidetes bacterium]|nr:adenosylcobinamide-phosphate synthase CbiB [Bacteroidota bacterium]